MKIGDYVFDSDLGLWGLIIYSDVLDPARIFGLLYEDGDMGEAYESALGGDLRQLEREGKWAA